MQSHPTATGLRTKSFPFLEQWSVVFGKDRANGLVAESLVDAVEDIDREESTNEGRGRNVEVDMNNNLDNEELDDNPVDEGQSNNSPTPRTESSASKGTRKRRISSTDSLNESIAKTICSMENKFGTASDNIAKLAGCFQFMADDAAKKDGVSVETDKIQGLSLLDRIKAGAIISGDTSKTNYFFSLADDKKSEYVRWILGGCQM